MFSVTCLFLCNAICMKCTQFAPNPVTFSLPPITRYICLSTHLQLCRRRCFVLLYFFCFKFHVFGLGHATLIPLILGVSGKASWNNYLHLKKKRKEGRATQMRETRREGPRWRRGPGGLGALTRTSGLGDCALKWPKRPLRLLRSGTI